MRFLYCLYFNLHDTKMVEQNVSHQSRDNHWTFEQWQAAHGLQLRKMNVALVHSFIVNNQILVTSYVFKFESSVLVYFNIVTSASIQYIRLERDEGQSAAVIFHGEI